MAFPRAGTRHSHCRAPCRICARGTAETLECGYPSRGDECEPNVGEKYTRRQTCQNSLSYGGRRPRDRSGKNKCTRTEKGEQKRHHASRLRTRAQRKTPLVRALYLLI